MSNRFEPNQVEPRLKPNQNNQFKPLSGLDDVVTVALGVSHNYGNSIGKKPLAQT
jgi:hypothetical protein